MPRHNAKCAWLSRQSGSLLVALVIVVPLSAACGDRIERTPTAVLSPDVRALVTPEVAAKMTPDGHFAFSALTTPVGTGMITGDTAVSLARQYLATYGKFLLNPIEPLRGERVDLLRLVPRPSPFLADTPVESPPSDGGMPLRKHLGPYYLVDFFLPGTNERVLNVAVSAYASDVRFTKNGLEAAGPHGNEFRYWVTPRGQAGEPRIRAEEAVAIAYAKLGRRTASVPTFVRMHPEVAPQVGRWRLELDAPVTVIDGDGATHNTAVIYVAADRQLQVPSVRSTPTFPIRYESGLDGRTRTANLATRNGYALVFSTVHPR